MDNQPNPQPQEITQFSTPQEVQKPKSNKWLVIVLVILLLASLCVTGYFGWQNYQLRKQIANIESTPKSSSEISSPTSSPTPSPHTLENTNDTQSYAQAVIRKAQFEECYKSIYETTRKSCLLETGYDPGPADGSGRSSWTSMSDEEKQNEVKFWICYERVSLLQEHITCGKEN